MTQAVPNTTPLPWGRHKGEPIEDLPEEYLGSVAWAIVDKNSEFFTAPNTRSYVLGMMEELRNRGQTVSADNALAKLAQHDAALAAGGPALPIEGGTVEMDDLPSIAADLQLPSVAPAHPEHIHWDLTHEAIDQFSKEVPLLKLFLVRTNKEIGLASWLLATAQEAFKYGDTADDTHPANLHIMEYAGMRIEIEQLGSTRQIKSLKTLTV